MRDEKPIAPNAVAHFMAIVAVLGDDAPKPRNYDVRSWRRLIEDCAKMSIPDAVAMFRRQIASRKQGNE